MPIVIECPQLPCSNICGEWDGPEKRNFIASILAGVLFASGWWIVIDAAAQYPSNEDFAHAYHTCGVMGTIAFFMINSVSNSQISGDGMTDGHLGVTGSRIWFFIGMMTGFGALIAAFWILFGAYVIPGSQIQLPGVAIFLQNMFIFLSSIVYKFGRVEE